MKVPGSILFVAFSALTVGSLSFGMDQQEFHQSFKRLKNSQKITQQKLIQLGIKPEKTNLDPFASATSQPESESPNRKKQPLFMLHDSASLIRAQAGKLLFGKTYNRLVVGGEPAQVILELIGDQGIFSRLRALGKARQSGTEGRIAIEFDRLVTHQGTVISIKGIAEDEAGASGLEAQVFSSKALAVAGAMGASFISGLAASQQSQAPTAFGFSQVQPTGRNALLQGVAQSAADQSKRLIEESTQEKPILVVEAGTSVTLYLDEEVRF